MKLGSSIRRRRRRGRGRTEAGGPRWNRRGKLAGLAVGLGVAGLAVGYLFATRVLFPAPAPPTDMVEVPNLRGLGLEAAAERLAREGIALGRVDSIRYDDAPEGEIFGQSPLPGQLILPDGSVRVALSLGAERRPVPDATGIPLERALVLLESAGFTTTVDSVESDEPRGAVTALEPAPGTALALASTVLLHVSLGPPFVEVPHLLGLDEEEALDVLESLGLEAEVGTRFRFGLDQGKVVEQEPPAGREVAPGGRVRIVVGRRSRGGGDGGR